MIKANTRYETMRASSMVLTVFGLTMIGAWIYVRFSMYGSAVPFSPIGPLFLAEALFQFLQMRRFKRLEARRQAAASGNRLMIVPLAVEQPVPNEEALSLPFTITMQPRWWRSIAAGGLLGLLMILGITVFLLISGLGDWMTHSRVALIMTLSFALLVFLPTSAFLVWAGHRQITATEEGLTVRQTGKTIKIPWREVSLFAIMPRWVRPALPNLYELSSADMIVYLHRVRRNALFPLSMKPALPFDDYDRQMEALLSLIAAKTGLPLYDLR